MPPFVLSCCQRRPFLDMIVIMSEVLEAHLSRLYRGERTFAGGETLFCQGDPIRLLYVVRSGTIHLVRHQVDGAALIIQRARPGSVLAEASVYAARYHCDAIAETPATAGVIQRTELRRQLSEHPELSEAWASYLAREVQRARLHAEILSLKTVSSRLSAWIAANGPLPGKGHWSAIAQEIGVSPEALYREIARRAKR